MGDNKNGIITNAKTLSLLFNLAIASARLRKIIIKEPKDTIEISPQLHIMLSSDKGLFKSTILFQIARMFKTNPYNELSDASLVGTIDSKVMQFVPGASWDARNGVLILDEFIFFDSHNTLKGIVNNLLQLTEREQYVDKRIARFSSTLDLKEGDLWLKVKDGRIQCKTSFSLIIGTMSKLNFRNPKLDALKSRCIPIVWLPSWELVMAISEGNKIFKYEDLLGDWKKCKTIITIKEKDYLHIRDLVKSRCSDITMFMRCINDCCRAFAILKKHDNELYNLILDLKLNN